MLNNGSATPSLADIAAVTGDRNNEGFGFGGGWWAIILLFALFGWGGNGFGFFGNGGGNAVTATQLQSGFDTQSILSKIDGVTSQVNALGYDQLGRLDSLSSQIAENRCDNQSLIQNAMMSNMQNSNNIMNQMSNQHFAIQQGQSDIRYTQATDACAIKTAIADAVREITQNDNANYRALHDENIQAEMNRLKELIAEKDQTIGRQELLNSQQAQNNELINALRPTAIPAYPASNPWGGCPYGSCS